MILIVGQNAAWQKVCLLPRLARGEVNRADQVMLFGSSKGPNVARALAALHGDAKVLGYAGGINGGRVRESLEAEGIHAEWVAIAAETRCCTTFVEPSGVTTEVIEPSPSVMPAEREEYDRLFNQRIAGAGLLVIAGRAVEGETPDCYRRFLAKARALDIATLLDSSGPAAAAALQAGPDILKVNQRELEELSGTPADTLDGRVRACRSLASRWGIRWFLVSRGADGIEGFDGAVLLHAAAPAVPVRNPIGSGDAATAGAAWAVHEMLRSRAPREILTKRASLERALADAAAMGTANCLNAMNARVIEEDYLRIRQQVRVSRLPIP